MGTPIKTIQNSVGKNATNDRDDVKLVRDLLAKAPKEFGGPAKSIPGPSHAAGHHLVRAIRDFQAYNFLASNGRIDPNGATIMLLQELAAGSPSASVSSIIARYSCFYDRCHIVQAAQREATRADKVAGATTKRGRQTTAASAARLRIKRRSRRSG